MKVSKLPYFLPVIDNVKLETNDSFILQHLREEEGHDNWFFEDMEVLGLTPISKPSSPPYKLARKIKTKEVDLKLIYTVELTSRTLFLTTAKYFPYLKWFGNTHLEAELAHTLWSDPSYTQGLTPYEDILQVFQEMMEWLTGCY